MGDPDLPEAGGQTTVRLARELTLLDATLLGVGALVGGGIFVLPGLAAGLAGPGVWLALALNALVTIPTVLVYAELSSGFHDAGGGYLWVKEALGRGLGFLGGWMSWFSHAVACGVYALASSAYLLWLLGRYGLLPALDHELLIKLGAVGITLLFVLLNVRGVRQAARAENLVTTIVLAVLAVFLAFGILQIVQRPAGLEELHLFSPEMLPNGVVGLFLAMGLTFIAFEGYEIVAQASEEVRKPERNVPRACILSVAIVTPLLVLVAIVAMAAVTPPVGQATWQWLGGHGELALVEAAEQFVPLGIGGLIVLVGAMLSNITALNSTIYSSSRVSFAMGRAGVLPRAFSAVDARRQTPATSILFSGALIAGMAATLPLRDVAAAADIMFLTLFFLVNVSYLKLRKTARERGFAFRAPGFPWLPLVGIGAQVVLAAALYLYSPAAWLAAGAWMLAGVAVHTAYARRQPAPAPPTAKAFEIHPVTRRDYRVLLPVANPASIAPLASVARDLAKARNGEVILLHVVTVPWTTLPSAARHLADDAKPLLAQAGMLIRDVPVHAVIQIAHDPAAAILATAEEEDANLILLGWRGGKALREHVLGSTLDPVIREAPCDVAVLRAAPGERGRVLVGARGKGKHARLGAEIAGALARARGTRLVGVTVLTSPRQIEPEARLAGIVAGAGIGPWETDFLTVEAPNAEEGLFRSLQPADLLVLGASDEPAWKVHIIGTVPERIARRAHEASVLIVKRQTPAVRWFLRWSSKLSKALQYLKPD